jgi:spore coat protein U-like protein
MLCLLTSKTILLHKAVYCVAGGKQGSRIKSVALYFSLALLLSSARVHAQEPHCTFGLSSISFGKVDLSKGDQFDAAGAFTYSCTSDPNEILRICPSLAGMENDGTRWMMDSAGNKLAYNIYTDVDRNAVWGKWDSQTGRGATIDVPSGRPDRIRLTGSKSLYGRITSDQLRVPPGIYKATIDGNNIIVSYGYASKGSCTAFKNGSKVSGGFVVSATVAAGESRPSAGSYLDTAKQMASASAQWMQNSSPYFEEFLAAFHKFKLRNVDFYLSLLTKDV